MYNCIAFMAIVSLQEINTYQNQNHLGPNLCEEKPVDMVFMSDPPHLAKKLRYMTEMQIDNQD